MPVGWTEAHGAKLSHETAVASPRDYDYEEACMCLADSCCACRDCGATPVRTSTGLCDSCMSSKRAKRLTERDVARLKRIREAPVMEWSADLDAMYIAEGGDRWSVDIDIVIEDYEYHESEKPSFVWVLRPEQAALDIRDCADGAISNSDYHEDFGWTALDELVEFVAEWNKSQPMNYAETGEIVVLDQKRFDAEVGGE